MGLGADAKRQISDVRSERISRIVVEFHPAFVTADEITYWVLTAFPLAVLLLTWTKVAL